MKQQQKCATCRFWQKPDMKHNGDPELGTCHCHAPDPCYGQESEETAWPMTYVDDWCGEWQAREKKK